MEKSPAVLGTRRGRISAAAAVSLTCVGLVTALGTAAQAAATGVDLGTAGSFAVLAGAGLTNTGTTVVSGNVGTYPTTTETGTSGLVITGGSDHGGDAVTQGAHANLGTAYTQAAAEGPATAESELGGLRLAPGVYGSASSLGLTGALTLDAGGDPNAVFIFQAGSTLTTASASSIVLAGSAQACHVFWAVGSSATLGTGSSFVGSILAQTSITVTTGVTVAGRLLASGGAVTLDTDRITVPVCSAAVITPTTAAPVTTTPAPLATTTAPSTPTPSTAPVPPVGSTSPAATTNAGTAATTAVTSTAAAAGRPARPTSAPTPTLVVRPAALDAGGGSGPRSTGGQAPPAAGGSVPRSTGGQAPPAAGTSGSGPQPPTGGGTVHTTSQQVVRVPSGSVHAGDGSTSPRADRAAPGMALLLAGVGGALSLVSWRRRVR